jgi:hypothetical protein
VIVHTVERQILLLQQLMDGSKIGGRGRFDQHDALHYIRPLVPIARHHHVGRLLSCVPAAWMTDV